MTTDSPSWIHLETVENLFRRSAAVAVFIMIDNVSCQGRASSGVKELLEFGDDAVDGHLLVV